MSRPIFRTETNSTLRKLYRTAKSIAKNAEVGRKIMCPCGCLQEFHKKSENQIFQKPSGGNGSTHKDRYYTRVRSTSNYMFDDKMLMIERRMTSYIAKNKDLLPANVKKNKVAKKEEFSKDIVSSDISNDNFIALMKQNKSINKNKNTGEKILCPCGCGESTIKGSYQQAYAQSELVSHKDTYYNITRGDVKLDLNDPKVIKSYNIMHKYVEKEIKSLKVEEPKNKTKKRSTNRRKYT